jgi:hypothetical protein
MNPNYTNLYDFSDKPIDWNILPLYKKIEYTATRFQPNIVYFVDKLYAKQTASDWISNNGTLQNFNIPVGLVSIPNTIRILSDASDVSVFDLDSNIMIKSTHGLQSAYNIDVDGNWDVSRVLHRLQDFERPKYFPIQTQYNYITKRYFSEQKIEDRITELWGKAIVYSIYMIQGIPVAYSECFESRYNLYELIMSGNTYIDKIEIKPPTTRLPVPILPNNIMQNLINISLCLSYPFEFIRMDYFVDIYNQIWFNEYTLTPNCTQKIFTDEKEIEYGLLWN